MVAVKFPQGVCGVLPPREGPVGWQGEAARGVEGPIQLPALDSVVTHREHCRVFLIKTYLKLNTRLTIPELGVEGHARDPSTRKVETHKELEAHLDFVRYCFKTRHKITQH